MRAEDLRQLPKLRDRLSYLYVEHCRIDRQDSAIALHDDQGMTHVPVASLALLMLGPGTSVTQQAILVLADANCLVAWCGEEGVRFYASGQGGTRSSSALIHQARLVSDPTLRMGVARRLYTMRFKEPANPSLSMEQLRGWEGRRVRDAYEQASRACGVEWNGRHYDRRTWGGADPVNRALSAANSCLYGICHAAIVSLGLSPALGFIHTGKQLSFVYDLADLYKTDVSIPLAFRIAADGPKDVERRTRHSCRDLFRDSHLLERIAGDIQRVLGLGDDEVEGFFDVDQDAALPGALWDPDFSTAQGGVNHGDSSLSE